ncbi:vWA domain-containing protein [Nitratireductor sp. GCM10026969]|uniref:vWA domain-containing protein n=1 Tax=Nitratireductor sp. GCM10026969 TaxID=3252645 RepID=UPI003606A146
MHRLHILAFLLAFCVPPAFAQSQTTIVLDGSNSMWGQIDGTPKIEIARNALRDVLHAIPTDTQLGMVVYGHRQKGSCTDIEVAVPVGEGTAKRITGFADEIVPKGKTPLSDSVRLAAEEMGYQTDPSSVVLITDGVETCHSDPCSVARELEEKGADFTLHVIGFGLSDDEGKQVACMAESTGGRYLPAADAAQLSEALAKTMVPEPVEVENNLVCTARLAEGSAPMAGNESVQWEFLPIDEAGNPTGRNKARINDGVCKTHLPPGRYLAQARLGNVVKERSIVLSNDKTTETEVVFNAGLVTVTAKQSSQDKQPNKDVHLDLASPDGVIIGQGKISAFVGAGSVTAVGRDGSTVLVEDRELSAGEELEIDLIFGSGVILPSAVYADGQPMKDDSPVRYDLLDAEPNADGERAVIALDDDPGREGIEVPAGRYLLRARLDQAEAMTPVTVETAKSTQATVNLDAGVLHVRAPGAYRIEFFEALAGDEVLGGAYGEETEKTFGAGVYQVRVAYGRGTPERYLVATVEAGERTEVTVEYQPLAR